MKKLLIFLCVVVLLLGGGIFAFTVFYKPQPLSQAEREKAMTDLLGRKVQLSSAPVSTAWVSHKGKYLSLMRPQAAMLYTADKEEIAKNKTILEKIDFYQQQPRWTFVILVTNANGATSVDDASGVSVRKTNTAEYTQSSVKIGPYNGLRFVKKDGTEDTSFFYASGRFYSFAATGGVGQNLEELTTRVLQSVEFTQ